MITNIVSYSVVDNYGQKVLITEEGLAHSDKHQGNSNIPQIIRNGSYLKSLSVPDKWAYIDDKKRMVMVLSDGNTILLTAYTPRNLNSFKRTF